MVKNTSNYIIYIGWIDAYQSIFIFYLIYAYNISCLKLNRTASESYRLFISLICSCLSLLTSWALSGYIVFISFIA